MASTLFYPDLKIVPISGIKLQEYIQKDRMQALASAIKREAMLKNPPIVTNFFNGDYLHLDGANRITAVSLLSYPNCLVQVVDYGDPTHVHLSSWSHLAHVNESQFFSSIKKMNNITVKKVNSFNHRSLFRPYVLCVAACNNRNIYEITSKAPFTDLVKQMGDIVDLYGKGEVERVFSGSPWTDETIGVRFERYPEKNLFVAFPTFSPQQVMTLVDRGVLMPAGITRHVVYRRKLNVNLPLDYLAITPLEKANEKLQLFLQHRTVRLYEEPVIYFE